MALITYFHKVPNRIVNFQWHELIAIIRFGKREHQMKSKAMVMRNYFIIMMIFFFTVHTEANKV